MIGTEIVARAAPDGYTLLNASTGAIIVRPALGAKLGYDPIKDLAPITLIAASPNLLLVHLLNTDALNHKFGPGSWASHAAFAQADYARDRLGSGASVELIDYRDARGVYDGIASVEMVEAVGQRYWPDYLAAIYRLLKPGGRAAIQYILIDDAIFERYARGVDFIQTYIFPGGMLISESRFRRIAQEMGLEWRDERRFGLHYAETLRRWRQCFENKHYCFRFWIL